MAAPKAIAKGMQNTVNEFMSNPQKVLLKAKKLLVKWQQNTYGSELF